MSQAEILECLEKAGEPLARSEIVAKTKLNKRKISHILQKLLKHNEIKCMEIDRMQAKKFYKVSRRMRLYYV